MRDKIWYMAIVLGLVAAVAGLALAGVKDVTTPIIEKRTLEQGIKPTLETFFKPVGVDNDYIGEAGKLELGKDDWGRKIFLPYFVGKKGGNAIAVALQTAKGGYGGDIEVLTVIDLENKKVLGVKALAQKETKGLGARVGDDSEPFIQQFSGMGYENGVALKAGGGEVDAISGATISSGAFAGAVNEAVRLLAENTAEITGK